MYDYRCETFRNENGMWWIRANNQWDTLISKNKSHVVLHPLSYTKEGQRHTDSIVYTPIGELIRSKEKLCCLG